MDSSKVPGDGDVGNPVAELKPWRPLLRYQSGFRVVEKTGDGDRLPSEILATLRLETREPAG
nr:MAG TPA: hypothetical protein [Caudoviricetes sp.]